MSKPKPPERACMWCGEMYPPYRATQKYCCDECGNNAKSHGHNDDAKRDFDYWENHPYDLLFTEICTNANVLQERVRVTRQQFSNVGALEAVAHLYVYLVEHNATQIRAAK